MTGRLTLAAMMSLPDGRVLVAAQSLSDGADLGAVIRACLARPGCEAVTVSRRTTAEVLEQLRQSFGEVQQVTAGDLAGVN